jgi:hypothetical protein
MDQSKKTMRHFYCRDVLWETFEQMANDFDCSIDYLVNEAMRYYARSKNYQPAGGPGGPGPGGPGGPGAGPGMTGSNPVPPGRDAGFGGPAPSGGAPMGGAPKGGAGAAPQPMGARGGAGGGTQPPPPRPMGGAAGGGLGGGAVDRNRPAPPTPGFQPASRAPMPNGNNGNNGAGAPPPAANGANGSAGSGNMTDSRPPVPLGGGPTLFLVYNGQRYPVTKDQFIIGRGSKTSDLPIKDGNISRKHAAVIRRNGTFYIKDLGSTNGIDYKGMRIDNKRIDEGDVFHLCDYELRFTYRVD